MTPDPRSEGIDLRRFTPTVVRAGSNSGGGSYGARGSVFPRTVEDSRISRCHPRRLPTRTSRRHGAERRSLVFVSLSARGPRSPLIVLVRYHVPQSALTFQADGRVATPCRQAGRWARGRFSRHPTPARSLLGQVAIPMSEAEEDASPFQKRGDVTTREDLLGAGWTNIWLNDVVASDTICIEPCPICGREIEKISLWRVYPRPFRSGQAPDCSLPSSRSTPAVTSRGIQPPSERSS